MIRNSLFAGLVCIGLATLPPLAVAQAESLATSAPVELAEQTEAAATVEPAVTADPVEPVPVAPVSQPAATAERTATEQVPQAVPEAETSVVITRKNVTPGHAVPSAGGSTLLSVMMALVAVVVMIFLTAWLIKRFTGLSPINNRQIKVVASLPVGARERLVLVEVGGQQMLLGVTPQQINTLHRFEEPVVVPDKPGQMDFAQRLQAMLSKGPTE